MAVEPVTLEWHVARGTWEGSPTPYPENAQAQVDHHLAVGDHLEATVVPVTLEWHLAACEKCDWKGNPTAEPADAAAQLDDHLAEAHAESEA